MQDTCACTARLDRASTADSAAVNLPLSAPPSPPPGHTNTHSLSLPHFSLLVAPQDLSSLPPEHTVHLSTHAMPNLNSMPPPPHTHTPLPPSLPLPHVMPLQDLSSLPADLAAAVSELQQQQQQLQEELKLRWVGLGKRSAAAADADATKCDLTWCTQCCLSDPHTQTHALPLHQHKQRTQHSDSGVARNLFALSLSSLAPSPPPTSLPRPPIISPPP
jgi:hypothetical protein